MTLTDIIHDSYIKIYEGIKTYNYSIEQYTNLLNCMVSLQRVIFSLNHLNYGDKITDEDEKRIEEECKSDFARSYKGEDY